MAITSITRDWGIEPCIVRIVSTDDLATVSGVDYITDQAANIEVANNGAFEWLASDSVLVYASDGSSFYVISADFSTLEPMGGSGGGPFLAVANNLSDVANAATSRTNLGLGSASNVAFNSLTLPNTGLKLQDTNASNVLTVKPGSDLTGDRLLTLTTGDANRVLDISAADVTISGFAVQYLDEPSAPATLAVLGAQNAANIIAATTVNLGGSGAGPISISVVGLTSASVVVGTVESSSNPVSVIAATAGVGSFDVTFSADPGANCFLNYVAFVAPQ